MDYNNFNDMDDLFRELMNGLGGFNSENRRYLINGRQVTPEEFAEYQKTGQLPGQGQAKNFQGKQKKANGILEKLGRNLTAEAREGKLDPVIGRNKEIQETAEILSRRTKNNPVLVGDAGVGKTAVVEGLAQAIVHGNVPEAIKNKEIISIDISSLEAGTQYRGSFEQNIQDLVKEVKDRGNVILFFDEIHQILGAGGMGDGNGSKGMSDILKPALSRGEITVIGATTQDEYRNTIMKDTALARRFNEVTVNAPSPAETFKILKGIRSLYEKHHNVELPDDVLRAAIDYSVQYIPQRSLPDKAIDLLDMTAAHLAAQHPVTDAKTIEKQIKEEKQAQEKAAEKEDYEAALDHKAKAEKLEKQLSENHKERKTVATPADVAAAVERLTGIPVSKMGASDIERLKGLSSRLKAKVIGQDEAVEAVAKAIRRNRAGFDEGNRPIGSFLFVGPTGVGKTELAKQLALDMFGSKDAIIRLDMSEYSDRTAVSKLIGTTAGYVGYDDNSNTLTEKVRRNPYSIILLDEIEKADPQVITLLLQVLDDGRLTDGQGNTVNFKNTIIIATSNAGFGNEQLMGDAKKDEKLMDRLAPYFRPEFLNRFNAVIEFKHLTKEDLKKIVNLMLADVNKTLAKKGISLTVSESAKDYLIEQGYDEAMGARPLRRVIEQEIRDKVTDYYLDHLDVKKLKADMVDGTLVISEDK
ncbi:ATP-dependent Clp protease ATP-binding subunit [Lactobacillus delbrueckii subsp. lactis]|jgi:ATP-dependent Clp protease ATP-binding subunit ClpL|uniref:ATP-dependent Clp protease ATP-binding subunit n=4 Tax=Lactobacillus delbrueckii TaxID=1584 RepID=A0A061CFR3_LACDL|nr:ATP-dependent Clp protease ATP-binding subunit [Lactobacillus delbrueckii]AZA15341.1 MAG: ATP-dependent Clp protease ATP-binding subunit [Lactobacillus delbrueckii subsp. lactis]AZA26060.1 MAG: ATP-dependent Clp protease ATP-binding subunit [Lactobacillus delbrueckii subsp. lactis]MBM6987526.1 ATP-dependent Clp protease ATP-binding subunit [Lactobacillus delbrueckii]MBO1168824.1 ATP-dependent Clp protease ATP-binding subunit [Lactobacillus delbrueckii subsp. lactis]MBO1170127.1 ATP-dependen